MEIKVIHHYNTDHNVTSAQVIVPYLLSILETKPTSVIDVGCGLAQWLNVFKSYGVEKVLGVDGSHVPPDRLNIEKTEFKTIDLRNFTYNFVGKRYDLLLCLEVVEHLEEQYAYQFIKALTELSDTILFSAAVPNQTGENHFNEQYPDYWVNLFSNFGYSFLDPFRKKFWQNEQVNWWYKQNMFLVVKNELKQSYNYPYDGNIYIHPKLLELQASISKNSINQSSQKSSLKTIIKSVLKNII